MIRKIKQQKEYVWVALFNSTYLSFILVAWYENGISFVMMINGIFRCNDKVS